MTECTTYEWGHRIWLECYTPGEGVTIFAFKNEKQVERAAKALILLLRSTALAGERYQFFRHKP